MNKEKSKAHKPALKKNVLQWAVILAVVGLLYITGMHSHVMAYMHRAIMFTGIYNAQTVNIETADGPYLSGSDYDFTLATSDGGTTTLGDYEGKVLFINIWASWCPPCIAEMPSIETLYQAASGHDDIRFLMISVDQERGDAVEFMKNGEYTMPYQFPVTSLPGVLQSSSLPTTYVISKEGQVVYKKEGIADYSRRAFREWLINDLP